MRRRCGIALGLLVLTLSACTGDAPAPARPTPEATTGSPTGPRAGLVATDGTPVDVPVPDPPTGSSYDVTELDADPEPGTGDDAPAIREALATAGAGDEVVLPAGVYDLRSTDPDDAEANLLLPDGVRLRGAGQGATVLRTSLDGEDDSAVVRAMGVHDAAVAGLTISSEHTGALGTDPDDEGPGGGPMYGVQIGDGSRRILVEDVSVELFQRHGITLKGTREVTVTGCRVADATSVGPGGSGYGIAVEGMADQRDPDAGDDSRHNVVVDNHLDGTHLRHGILLQFPTHNNLIAGNTIDGGVLDAIDLHGEGEYLNEIRDNTVTDVPAAAVALGNSGGEKHRHDASGEGNWVHDNRLVGNLQGVLVILGTPDTLVEDNDIVGSRGSAVGIELRNAPGTVVRDNSVAGGDADFWAIVVTEDEGTDGRGAGVATDVLIAGNRVTGPANGIDVEAGRAIEVTGNSVDVDGTPVRVSPDAEVRGVSGTR
ncbi:nitrous oxide reductase family maturation protein NosD [Nocardioides sp. zg-1228]|uniref:right-handed parallel beta-helix repeat-containing protein n=1 Tax=Nocardioides sp. zg-1228 TaxID=2763008 RepID=UPI0016430187|nr:right-handed parallel beta-helix repeat-containing protein [Nocardioides sp. zg-1228]MBC2935158.1 right-handed parallel beta-helix repeat-containing protein [Nocardioides sp. zg-1228]QSF56974.1 right-handed parallel beta-helix repeat-containing protein [Nocardioides sp. zg-1228]